MKSFGILRKSRWHFHSRQTNFAQLLRSKARWTFTIMRCGNNHSWLNRCSREFGETSTNSFSCPWYLCTMEKKYLSSQFVKWCWATEALLHGQRTRHVKNTSIFWWNYFFIFDDRSKILLKWIMLYPTFNFLISENDFPRYSFANRFWQLTVYKKFNRRLVVKQMIKYFAKFIQIDWWNRFWMHCNFLTSTWISWK